MTAAKLAVAAEPVLGSAGYWLMTVTALFATAGATNSGLFPAAGLAQEMAAAGQFPPTLGRKVGDRAPVGILVTAVAAIVLAVFFDLNAIASIGSAVALVLFTLVTYGHLRIRHHEDACVVRFHAIDPIDAPPLRVSGAPLRRYDDRTPRNGGHLVDPNAQDARRLASSKLTAAKPVRHRHQPDNACLDGRVIWRRPRHRCRHAVCAEVQLAHERPQRPEIHHHAQAVRSLPGSARRLRDTPCR